MVNGVCEINFTQSDYPLKWIENSDTEFLIRSYRSEKLRKICLKIISQLKLENDLPCWKYVSVLLALIVRWK